MFEMNVAGSDGAWLLTSFSPFSARRYDAERGCLDFLLMSHP